jgi:hypothetical protein
VLSDKYLNPKQIRIVKYQMFQKRFFASLRKTEKEQKTKVKNRAENIIEWPRGRLDLSAGCVVMGVLNVTPDSFSEDGQFFDTQKAI